MKNTICKLVFSLALVASILAAGLAAALAFPDDQTDTACILEEDEVSACILEEDEVSACILEEDEVSA